VVVDSLASAHNLDENESKSMRVLFDDIIAPFCEEFNCGFLAIDHERKDVMGQESSGGKRLRGSGAKGDAVDTLICLNERDGVVFFEQSKNRYGRREKPFSIVMEEVSNGLIIRHGGYL
jgi:hypothetical protein